jgi:hypothetical protein
MDFPRFHKWYIPLFEGILAYEKVYSQKVDPTTLSINTIPCQSLCWRQKVDTILIRVCLKKIENVVVHSQKAQIYGETGCREFKGATHAKSDFRG